MRPSSTRFRLLVPLVGFAALCLSGCSDTGSPTEPGSVPSPSETASLSGFVRDLSAVPMAGVELTCQGRSRVTTATGAFEFVSLTPGNVALAVYQKGVKDPDLFLFELGPGRNVRDVTVERFVGHPASLSGVIAFTPARSFGDVYVYCQARTTRPAEDGSYSFPDLESGYWHVGVSWDGYNGEHYTEVTLQPGANRVDLPISQ